MMLVFVLNRHGNPLMPCKPRKARLLLKEGKAKVVNREPFTIQLLYWSTGYKQPVKLGVDSGYTHVGVSATTEKEEVYASEVELRSDMVKLNSERRQYRRARRHRKTWHRKPRFLNRKKAKGWLAPSIQHKLDSHIKIIEGVKKILPIVSITIEVAAFDIQKIKHPDIEGTAYQDGEQSGFWNVREYVLHRDNHQCRHCKGKSKDNILNVHHLESRQTGGDRPDNLITLCKTCHEKLHKGKITLETKKQHGFKPETFMSIVRWKIVNQLREEGNNVTHTYGYRTKQKRIAQELPKSHINDAYVIADGNGQQQADIHYFQKQVRKCNRKMYKGIRSHLPNTAPRFIRGFQRFDKVLWKDKECFIFGRRQSGYFALRTLDGTKIHQSAKATDCRLLTSASTLLIERRTAIPPSD